MSKPSIVLVHGFRGGAADGHALDLAGALENGECYPT
jgi:predicted alpha/beta-fold hydrolase